MRLYAVTDRAWTGKQTLYEQAERALKGGATCMQLREKKLDEEAFLKEAEALGRLCGRYHVPFIINDNAEIALKCHADGVHVGQTDGNVAEIRQKIGKDRILGVSAKTVEQAVRAEKDGADYLGVGAVFATSTKPDASVVSHDTVRQICDAVTIPVVAIGGVKEANIMELKGSGVDGVALVSAIFAAEDIEKTCRALRAISEEMIKA